MKSNPSTYSQIYIQIIFAVQGRSSLISPRWEDELYKYISGIITNKNQKLLAINGMPDHIHILIGMKPSCCLADLVREIKKSSNKFIAEKQFSKYGFNWQKGYAAFSYSHSALSKVIVYINNQKVHHRAKSFQEEYIGFLSKFEVGYDERFLFEWIEDKADNE